MGIAERKEREKQEMRDLIVQAAAKVFAEEGYEGTSIRHIADKIEYSPATIYLYFKDKDELLFAIHDYGFQILLSNAAYIAEIPEPVERLRALARHYVQFCFDNPEYYNLMFTLLAPINVLEEKKPWNNGHQAFLLLQKVVQDCMEAGVIPQGDTRAHTFYYWSFVHGMVSLYNRCRMRILELSDEENRALIFRGIDEWIKINQL